MKEALLQIWQFPQHLLAVIIVLLTKAVKDKKYGVLYYLGKPGKRKWTVSLGRFIIVSGANAFAVYGDGEELLKHEAGHQKQSRLLGPLYLLVVGIYSALFCNVWDRVFHKDWQLYDRVYWYYKTRWTEKWADKLGKVDRDAWIVQKYQYTLGCKYSKL